MNKKIIFPIIAITVIIPILAFITLTPDADKIGKEFATNNPGITIGMSSIEEDISEQIEIDRALLIIEGTVQEVSPFWKIDSGDEYPYIQTKYAIKISHVIKGDAKVDQSINVLMNGGTLDGITAYTESITLQQGDNVVMLLGKDEGSIWGDSYHPVSVTKSTYLLEGEEAKNILESRTMDKADLREKLTQLSDE